MDETKNPPTPGLILFFSLCARVQPLLNRAQSMETFSKNCLVRSGLAFLTPQPGSDVCRTCHRTWCARYIVTYSKSAGEYTCVIAGKVEDHECSSVGCLPLAAVCRPCLDYEMYLNITVEIYGFPSAGSERSGLENLRRKVLLLLSGSMRMAGK